MNMTAPPAQMPIFTPSYLSPASAALSDSASAWSSMAPLQCNNAQQPRSSTSPPANEANGEANGFQWITGNKPADFKARSVMTKVRKQAMGSYLQKEKKPKPNGQRSRLQSEDSTGSRSSIGSDDQAQNQDFTSTQDALKLMRGKPRRRLSSSDRSPASSSQDQQAPTPDTQTFRIPPTLDMVLSSAPMVQPMRINVPLPFMNTSPRPFQSIGKSLDPFQTMFQAHHPHISVEELKFHCSRFFGTRAMGRHWIPTLVKSPHAFLSTLCIASAHFDAVQNLQIESIQTTALRQEVIHLIHQNILNSQTKVDDFNVIALTQLIASEIVAGEETSLNFHEKGVEAMVRSRGGLNQLGVDGRIASTLSWVSLESAVLREAKPRSIYSDHCAATSSYIYPNTATIPESPVFCPRGEFQTIERSQRCSSRTLELLKDIRMMLDLFLHETKHSRQNSQSLKNLYKKITSHYPSASELQKSTILNHNDWTYEAVRIAAILQATAIIKRIPLSEALKYVAQAENPISLYASSAASKSSESLVSPTTFRHDSPVTGISTSPSYATSPAYPPSNPFNFVPSRPSVSSIASDHHSFFPSPAPPPPSGPTALLTNIRKAIEMSDFSDCWSDMAGVLLWIGLVVGAASRKSDKVLKKWYSALTVRCSILLCFEHPKPVQATLLRMSEIVENLGFAEKGEEVVRRESSTTANPRRQSSGKRRKM